MDGLYGFVEERCAKPVTADAEGLRGGVFLSSTGFCQRAQRPGPQEVQETMTLDAVCRQQQEKRRHPPGLTPPLRLIPVLLDGHAPLPLQVDHLVVVDEPGLDHVLAVRQHALAGHPGRAHKLLGLWFGPVAPHHEARAVHCREDSQSGGLVLAVTRR